MIHIANMRGEGVAEGVGSVVICYSQQPLSGKRGKDELVPCMILKRQTPVFFVQVNSEGAKVWIQTD